MIRGSIVAIATPLKDGKVDEASLRELVDFQIANGTNGIVPCGTTGESATLTHEEHCQVIDIVIDQVNKRVPVIAGSGSNSTHETIFLTEYAKKAGADAALLITPYYNKPSQEGLYEHFKAVAEAVDIPIILYNVPSRTAVNMLPETVIKLSKIDNIIGVKEATGSLDQAADIIANVSEDFIFLSGEDALVYPLMAIGAKGVISVMTNVAPADMSALCKACDDGDFALAKKLHYKMLPLINGLFIETNPVPVKKALSMMGQIGDEIRMPLVELSDDKTGKLKKIMEDYGIL